MLKMPAWADAQHPIVRHEQVLWRRFLSRWWWLALIPIGFVLLTALCSVTSNLPIFVQLATVPATPELGLVAGGFIVQSLYQSLWNLNTTVQWVIGVAIGFGSAVTIARERENRNWELLCLTPLSATEIALAKVYSIVRQFLWPLIITTVISLGLIFLLVFGIIGGVAVFTTANPGLLPPDLPLFAIVLTIIAAPALIFFSLVNTVLDIANSLAVGLAASCWATTRANAIVLAIVANFILNVFILGPLYFILFIGIALIGGLLSLVNLSPVIVILAVVCVIAVLYIVFRAATVLAAVVAARYQLNRRPE